MHVSDPEFRLMHPLRLRGVVSREWLESVVGEEERAALSERLAALRDGGLVKELTGRLSGFTLTKEGRARHAELLEEDKAAGDLPTTLRAPYERFLSVNQPFIDLCSAWQMRRDTGEPNDHTDEAYDAGIVEELEQIHETGDKVGEEVGAVAERFASYRPRLQNAIEQVRAGEMEWFTKPTIDSYHTVWFELHEDLLVSQGIERAEGR
jgi:hypothetical protein